MYFSTAVVLAALPFLVGAVPVQNSLRDVISIPLSKRSTFSSTDGAVNATGLQASIHYTMAKFQAGFEAFKRNTGKSHPLASKLSDKRNWVSVPLHDFHGSMWYGNLLVGSPARAFTAIFDTGSANLFLPGTDCDNCQGHTIYDPSLSSTATDLEQVAQLSYGRGGAAGKLYADDVYVGGFEATNYPMLVASQISSNFESTSFGADGILGLGFKGLSAFQGEPFFTALVDQGRVQEPVFGFYLAKEDSALVLGGRDSSRFKGSLTYVTVDTPAYWQTLFDGIIVNGINVPVSNKHAIIDTGTTLVLGDPDSISNFYKSIPNSQALTGSLAGLWSFPCDTVVNVSINFGGTIFKISPDTFNLGPSMSSGSNSCIGGFGATPTNTGFWVVGDVFLQNVYTEFDVGGLQVGFASLAY